MAVAPTVVKINTVADLKGILATQAALQTLGKRSRATSLALRNLTQGFTRLIKAIGKFSFIGMALDIGLVSAALAGVRLAMVVGQWAVRTYHAALRGLGVVAAGLSVALSVVAATVREFSEVSMAPLVGGLREARQILRGGLATDLLTVFGVQGIQGAMAELARSGVPVSAGYTNILKQLGNFAGADAQALVQLAAIYGEVNRQGTVTQDVMARLIQLTPTFAAAAVEAATGEIMKVGPATEDLAMKLAGEGKIAGSTFAKLFSGELVSTDLWEGQLEALNSTLFGRLKGMIARLGQMFAGVGSPFLEGLKGALSQIEFIIRRTFISIFGPLKKYGFEKFVPGLISGFEKFMKWAADLMVESTGKIEGFTRRMRDMWWGIKDWFIDVGRTFEPLVEGGRIIGKVLGPALKNVFGSQGLGLFIKEFNQLLISNRDLFETHGAILGRFVKGFMDIFREGQKAFTNALPVINKFLESWTNNVWPVLRDMISLFKEAVVSVLPGLTHAFQTLADVLRPLIQMLKSVVGLGSSWGGEMGGMVTGGAFLMLPWLLGLVGRGRGAGRVGVGAAAAAHQGAMGRFFGGARGSGALGMLGMLGGGALGASTGILPLALLGGFGGLMAGTGAGMLPGMVGSYRGMNIAGPLAKLPPMPLGPIAGAWQAPYPGMPISQRTALTQQGRAMADLMRNTPSNLLPGAEKGWSRFHMGMRAAAMGLTPDRLRMMRGAGGIGLLALSELMPEESWQRGATGAAGMGLSIGAMGGAFGKVGGAMAGFGMGQAISRQHGQGWGMLGGIMGGAATGAMVGGPWGALIGGVAGVLGSIFEGKHQEELKRKGREKAQEVGESFIMALDETLREGGGKEALIAAGEELTKLIENAEVDAKAAGVNIEYYRGQLYKQAEGIRNRIRRAYEKEGQIVESLSRITGKTTDEIRRLADVMGVDLSNGLMTVYGAAVKLGEIDLSALTPEGRAVAQTSSIYSALFEDLGSPYIKKLVEERDTELQAQFDEIFTGLAEGVEPSSDQLRAIFENMILQGEQGFDKFGADLISFLEDNAQMLDEALATGGFAPLFEEFLGGRERLVSSILEADTDEMAALKAALTSQYQIEGRGEDEIKRLIDQQLKDLQALGLEDPDALNNAIKSLTDEANALAIAGSISNMIDEIGISTNAVISAGGNMYRLSEAARLFAELLEVGSVGLGSGLENRAPPRGKPRGNVPPNQASGSTMRLNAAGELVYDPVSTQIGRDTSSPRGPLGDTSTRRFARALGFNAFIGRLVGGRRHITSGLRNFALGSIGSDHLFGRAFDLKGQNLGAYATAVNSLGGFAEPHGSGYGRHLHVVAPVGDTRSPTSAPAGGLAVPGLGPITFNINGTNASPEEIANKVIAKIKRLQREAQERS